MKALAVFVLAILTSGCQSFDIARIGTVLDGSFCFLQDAVTAKQRLTINLGLLDPGRDMLVIQEVKQLLAMKDIRASELCERARSIEGMLHKRYQTEKTYLYTF